MHLHEVQPHATHRPADSTRTSRLYGGRSGPTPADTEAGLGGGAVQQASDPCDQVQMVIKANSTWKQGEYKPYPKGMERWLSQQGKGQVLLNMKGDGNCIWQAILQGFHNHTGRAWKGSIQDLRNQTADKLLALKEVIPNYPLFFPDLSSTAAIEVAAASMCKMGRPACEMVIRTLALTTKLNIEARDSHTAQVLGLYPAALEADGSSTLTPNVPTVQLCLIRGGTHVYYNENFEEVRTSKGIRELEAERKSARANGRDEKDISPTFLKMADGHAFLVIDRQGNGCQQGSRLAPGPDLH